MKYALISLMLMMTACGAAMSPKEMQEKIKECEKHDLDHKVHTDGFTFKVRDISCYPKRD